MKVKVKLFFWLGKYSQTGNELQEVELTPNSTINQLLENIGIHPEKVALIFVNGKQQKMSTVLQEGDEVTLFPPVAGG